MPDSLMEFYDISPVGVIDQNRWDVRTAEVSLVFRKRALYTPLVDWDATPAVTGAVSTIETELIEGDVDANPIPLTANYIDAQGIDSRFRRYVVERHGGKVQYHKSDTYFNQWKISGGRDWAPLMRSLLGFNLVEKMEILARNAWFRGPKTYWVYSNGKTSIGALVAGDKFELSKVNEWHLRLGNLGSPIVPGGDASAKIVILPPGAIYDFFATLALQTTNEASMWRDTQIYGGQKLNFEMGSFKDIRFLQAPNTKWGTNPNVLYNTGAIIHQHGVVDAIQMGDGAPDPETTSVDGTWFVGQKNVTHTIHLEDFAVGDYLVNDWVTIHTHVTNTYGVTNGVDPFDGKTIVRRVVAVDAVANTLAFDRPISYNYLNTFAGASIDEATASSFYAFVTKGINIGFALVLGSRGAIKGKVLQPIQFYNPKPVDDFDSVWRFTYDGIFGHNIAEPTLFELYFFAVSVPKPGGVG